VKQNKTAQKLKQNEKKAKEMAEKLWNEVTKKVRVYVLL